MKPYATLALIAAILAGCALQGPLPRTMDMKQMTVIWVRSNAGCPYTATSNSQNGPSVVGGYTPLRAVACEELISSDTCIIRAYEPKNAEDTQVLGHEVLHCFFGDFHANTGGF